MLNEEGSWTMDDRHTPDMGHTKVDEAPALASALRLPIIRKFCAAAGVTIGIRDVSLAARLVAVFPERLSEAQRQTDDLAELGQLVTEPGANVLKLPNISASVSQLVSAINELQSQGYDLPDCPQEPVTAEEKEARARYGAIKGPAVNPVLREGNSDRRAAVAVRNHAKANPPSMGAWTADSKTRVSSMSADDFRSNEISATLTEEQAGAAGIELVSEDGSVAVLKHGGQLPAGTVVDPTFMSARALRAFPAEADQVRPPYPRRCWRGSRVPDSCPARGYASHVRDDPQGPELDRRHRQCATRSQYRQLTEEIRLRWDSLGEFCALGESLRFLAEIEDNAKARVPGDAVDAATQGVLDNDESPGRRAGQPDNRDSRFYDALYWAQALAAQAKDPDLAAHFAPIAKDLTENEEKIVAELRAERGKPADLGGYYHTGPAMAAVVMRPSGTLNRIVG